MDITKVYQPVLTGQRIRLACLFKDVIRDCIEMTPQNDSGREWLEHVLELTNGVVEAKDSWGDLSNGLTREMVNSELSANFRLLGELELIISQISETMPDFPGVNREAIISSWNVTYEISQRQQYKEVIEAYNKADTEISEKDDFRKVVTTEEFREFSNKVLKKYYGDAFFTTINGREYPVWIINAKPATASQSILDFDILSDYENSEFRRFHTKDHRTYRGYKWYKEYSKILEGTIKYPDRPGYMIKEIECDEEGFMTGFSARIGTYAENVFGTHVLEYEMYRLFNVFKHCDIDDPVVWETIKNNMPIRNRFHKFSGSPNDPDFVGKMKESLTHFSADTHSLLGVQMLVISKSEQSGQYNVVLAERSEDVAIKPNVFQFVPSGGFEVTKEDNIYYKEDFVSDFSAGCAVFREYLEELFNDRECRSRDGETCERLLKDKRICEINQLIQEQKAHLQFLGTVISLDGLRHELSFVLVIDDPEYARDRFKENHECKKGKIDNVPVSSFEADSHIWENLHGGSAAMWQMFKNTPLCKKTT